MNETPASIPGRSPAVREFAERLSRAAEAQVTVLIRGESGSGKSWAARLLHQASARRGGPLVEIDLVTLSPALIEAELFGHQPGAFTGATVAREGRFRRAHRGTLVLEDIERLPLDLQVKLLRVLQEREVEPVGAETAIPIDVRVVATTSLSLEEEAAAGRFRQDLYWRLAVLNLEVPPLRVRSEDLSELARSLTQAAAERVGVPGRPLSPEALRRLEEHPWPGNVRELENALERVLALGPRGVASQGPQGRSSAPIDASEFDFLDEAREGAAGRLAREALAHGLTLGRMEDAMLDTALEEQRGNHSAAARQIGLTRRALEYRLSRRENRDPAKPEPAEEGESGDAGSR
jgi:two-component system response regulator PilR (NtrC family)